MQVSLLLILIGFVLNLVFASLNGILAAALWWVVQQRALPIVRLSNLEQTVGSLSDQLTRLAKQKAGRASKEKREAAAQQQAEEEDPEMEGIPAHLRPYFQEQGDIQ